MNEETRLQSKCNAFLKKHGIGYFKHSEKWLSGIPDVEILSVPTVWIEYKTPTGRVSKIQQYTMDKLVKSGHKCYVVRSLEQLKEALRGSNLLTNNG